MFKRMGTYNLNGVQLEIGQQNFTNSTVPIKVKNKIIDCPMYQDDGDIYFDYNDNDIYFRMVNYNRGENIN